jgi:[ribosomal protein S18]-alanine N-acetyltransferase
VNIRPATAADTPAIRKLEQQSNTAAHWAEREYDALFAPETPTRVSLVAEHEDGGILGFLIARCVLKHWEIENIVVASEQRRGGIGSALVRRLLDQGARSGAASVHLEVRESNVAARQLYEKVGFSDSGRRTGYYRDPAEDALLMEISISVP